MIVRRLFTKKCIQKCFYVFCAATLAVILSIMVWGIYIAMFDKEINRCEMTFMYEMPNTYRIQLDKKFESYFRDYSFHYYTEGRRTIPHNQISFNSTFNLIDNGSQCKLESINLSKSDISIYSNFWTYFSFNGFTGVPVLFIHGNAGSFKQFRSMGSIALRMAEKPDISFHFDYFGVDFNEELNVVRGNYIHNETEYTAGCIKHIFSMYKTAQPKSIIIIGHSMGGVVARNLFLNKNFDPTTVRTIITLATPHLAPIIGFDKEIEEVYTNMNSYWLANKDTVLKDVVVISLMGGSRDIQVWDGYGDIRRVFSKERSLFISTTGVLNTWASADHKCIVWCRGLCMNLNKILFQSIDPSTKLIISDSTKRMSIFRRHLLVTEPQRHPLITPPRPPLHRADWIYKLDTTSFIFRKSQLRTPIYIKIGPLYDNPGKRIIISVSLIEDNWLFACAKNDSVISNKPCSTLIDISSSGFSVPPMHNKKKLAILNWEDLSRFADFLVVRLDPVLDDRLFYVEAEVSFELVSTEERFRTVEPSRLPLWLSSPIISTNRNSTFFRLVLPTHTQVSTPPIISLQSFSCPDEEKIPPQGIVGFYSPWNQGFTHAPLLTNSDTTLSLQFIQSKPSTWPSLANQTDSAYVDLLLDRSCQYNVHLSWSPVDSFRQIVRMNLGLIPAYLTAHILHLLSVKLGQLINGGSLPSAIYKGLLLNVKLLPFMFLCSVLRYIEIMPNPWNTLSNMGLLDLPATFLLPVLSLSLYWLLSVVFEILVVIFSAGIRLLPISRSLKWKLSFCQLGLLTVLFIGVGYRFADGIGLLGITISAILHCSWLLPLVGRTNVFHLHLTCAMLFALLVLFNTTGIVLCIKQSMSLLPREPIPWPPSFPIQSIIAGVAHFTLAFHWPNKLSIVPAYPLDQWLSAVGRCLLLLASGVALVFGLNSFHLLGWVILAAFLVLTYMAVVEHHRSVSRTKVE